MFRRDRFLYLLLLLSPSYLMPAQAIPYLLEMIKPAFTGIATALIAKGYTSYTGQSHGDQFSIGYSTGSMHKSDIPPSWRDMTAHKNVNNGYTRSGTNSGPISYDVAPTREDYSDKNNILDVEAYNKHAMEYSRRSEKEEKERISNLEAKKMAEKTQTVIDTCKDNYARERSRLKIQTARDRFKLKEEYYQEMAVINAEAINKMHAIDPSCEKLKEHAKEFKRAIKNRDICRINCKMSDEYLEKGFVTDTELSPTIQDLIRVSSEPVFLLSTENNNEKPSDKPDYDPSKDPKKFRRPKRSDERAKIQRPDPRSKGTDINLPDKPAQVGHIFAPRPGHIAYYTPGAVAVVKAAYKLGTYLGEDAMGNFHYVWTNPDDGNQIWLKVRDCGKLHDGGANTKHWGLSKHGFLDKPFDMKGELVKGVTYAVAGVVINAAYEGSGLKASVDDYFKGETSEAIKERMDKQREAIAAMQKTKMDYYQDVFDEIRKDNLSDPEKAAKLMKEKMMGPSFDVKTKEQVSLKNVAIKMAQRKLDPEPSLSDMLKDLKPEPAVVQPSSESVDLPVSFKMPTITTTKLPPYVEDAMRSSGHTTASYYAASKVAKSNNSKRSSSSDDDDSSSSKSSRGWSKASRWESRSDDSSGSSDSDSSSSSSRPSSPCASAGGAPPSGY